MDTVQNHYPEFDYPATQLSAFVHSAVVGLFIISLKGGKIVQFIPKDVENFKTWLIQHKVRDISVDKGPGNTSLQLPQQKTNGHE